MYSLVCICIYWTTFSYLFLLFSHVETYLPTTYQGKNQLDFFNEKIVKTT